MKKLTRQNGTAVLLLIASLVLIFIGLIKPFEVENPKIYKIMSAIGFSMQAFYSIKLFLSSKKAQHNKSNSS